MTQSDLAKAIRHDVGEALTDEYGGGFRGSKKGSLARYYEIIGRAVDGVLKSCGISGSLRPRNQNVEPLRVNYWDDEYGSDVDPKYDEGGSWAFKSGLLGPVQEWPTRSGLLDEKAVLGW